ncbi:hypothetical protein KC316_g8107 [Hortaea werneckii]|nr:hypothetical protein KC324_g1160 [Hortaea werneckii]KAI7582023.1 hypothetical protein KC316_g8107 [Hortaea werneckii]
MTTAKNKNDLMAYLLLSPPSNTTFKRWLGFGLNFKYYNYLREIEDPSHRVEKSTGIQALQWLQKVKPDPSVGSQEPPSENVKEDVETAVGKYMGRTSYEGQEKKLKFHEVLGAILFHWRQELRGFEDSSLAAGTKASWAQAFQNWNIKHSPDGKELPDEFQVLDLEASDIPLGLGSERPALKGEKEFEVYNRLFWQYYFFKSNVMQPKRWTQFWVTVANKDAHHNTLRTLPWYEEPVEREETVGSDEQPSNGNGVSAVSPAMAT